MNHKVQLKNTQQLRHNVEMREKVQCWNKRRDDQPLNLRRLFIYLFIYLFIHSFIRFT